MSPPLPGEIDALFDAALDQPAGDRAAWIVAACPQPAVRAEVLRLLRAHERGAGILEVPARDVLGLLDPGPDGGAPSDQVGPYRLVSEIGRGGMGDVFLAECDDGPSRRRVAVKVVRRGLDTPDLVRRFLAERQILASLGHPNIAKLLDSGVTDDGRPYFVMEYVDGLPIDQYADEKRLPIGERLQLVCRVARAIDHAHRGRVVHRDLKPSNILVTRDGTVKLVDFGIAKLLDPNALPLAAPITQTGLRLMTPEYASPEQVRGDAVTAATDVYGLGLVLYEQVTGRRPQRLTRWSPREIERVVCDTDPPAPSIAVSEGDDAVARAAARRATPAQLREICTGELDRIVARAISKVPEQRYPTAERLAGDLERYLDRAAFPAPATHILDRRWTLTAAVATAFIILVACAAIVIT